MTTLESKTPLGPVTKIAIISLTLAAAFAAGAIVGFAVPGWAIMLLFSHDEDANWRRESMYFLHRHVFTRLHVSIGQTGWDWGMTSLKYAPLLCCVVAIVAMIWVAVRKVIPALLRALAMPCEPACLQCGYNLTGNKSGVCSECGSEIVPELTQTHVHANRLIVALPAFVPFMVIGIGGPAAVLLGVEGPLLSIALVCGAFNVLGGFVILATRIPRLDWTGRRRRAMGAVLIGTGFFPLLTILALGPLLVRSR